MRRGGAHGSGRPGASRTFATPDDLAPYRERPHEGRPRLLVVSWYSADSPSTGEQVRLRALCEELSRHWEVHLVSFTQADGNDKHPWIDHPAPPVVSRSHGYSRSDRLLAAVTFRSVHRLVLRGVIRREWLEKVAREVAPSLLILNQLPASAAVPEEWWSRAVFDCHHAEFPRLRRRARSARPGPERAAVLVRAQLARRLEARIACRVAGVWAASESDAAYFRALGARRVWTVHNGTRLPETGMLPHVERRREDPVRLLYVGPLGYSANREGLREVLDEWAPVLPQPWTLDVVGGGMDPELAARVDANPRVNFVGWVDNIALEYASHDALIVPLRQAGAARLKVLEACAMGLPVLATAAAAEAVGLVDGTTYLRAESAREAAERVRWLRDHPEAVAILAGRAREHVRKFDWAAIGRIADTAVESLVPATGGL